MTGISTYHSSEVLSYVEVIEAVQFQVGGPQLFGELDPFRRTDAAPSVWGAEGACAG